MARSCTVCSHTKHQEIDERLAAGQTSNVALSSEFGVTETSLRRHKTAHLPALLAKAQQAQEVAQADTLLDQVRNLQARTLTILAKAEEGQDLRTALAAIAQACSTTIRITH